MTGGTESGNARLVGTLYEFDGKTPAAGVDVVIRPKHSLGDTSGNEMVKQTSPGHYAITDEKGMFAFDTSLENGIYIIEAISGSDAVLIDSVVLKEGDILLTLSPRSLKPAGALQGIVKLTEGGDPRKVFVLIYGIDRFSRVGADGSFSINNLAEADYDLRIVSSLDNYGVIDTADIPVVAGKTTDFGIVVLPFIGIPVVKNITITYDTLMQNVALAWDRVEPKLVSGYQVYRRNTDSNSVLTRINSASLTDTLYKDTTARQGFNYEYKVKVVDVKGNEGGLSNGVNVKIVSTYEPIKIIETQQESPRKSCFVLADSKIYVGGWGNKRIQIIDTAGRSIGFFGDTGAVALNSMRAITCKNNILYVADVDQYTSSVNIKSSIKCFDLSGMFIKMIPYPFPAIEILDIVIISDNEIVTLAMDGRYGYNPSRIQLFKTDSLGAILDSTEDSRYCEQIQLQDSRIVYAKKGSDGEIATGGAVFYDLDFNIVRTINIARFAKNGFLSSLAIGNDKYYSVVYENFNRVLVADSNGTLISRFETDGLAIIVDPKDLLYIWSGSRITVYKER
jgi:hypothetical protein